MRWITLVRSSRCFLAQSTPRCVIAAFVTLQCCGLLPGSQFVAFMLQLRRCAYVMLVSSAPLPKLRGHCSKNLQQKQPPKKAPKMVGVVVAMCAGFLFGVCFNPASYAIDQAAKHHCNPLSNVGDDPKATCLAYHGGDHGRIYCTWDGTQKDETKRCGGMPDPDLAFSQFCGIFFASFGILW